jgi:hypothetical protein
LIVTDAYGESVTTAFNLLVEKPTIYTKAKENGQIAPLET